MTTEPGFMAGIFGNSFMKREFGKKLIEEFFPSVDLTHVVDTSGAYIPGHGTPTVILAGRGQPPQSPTVRAAMGIKGELCTPENPEQGKVWREIEHRLERDFPRCDMSRMYSRDWFDSDRCGDLYQHLSEDARKGRALVQTPGFVANKLCEMSVTPAADLFGADVSVIDPACGSGHLLVRAFAHLYVALHGPDRDDVWDDCREILSRLHGIDLDPVCVALTRIRLAACVTSLTSCRDEGKVARKVGDILEANIVVGDALLGEENGGRPAEILTRSYAAVIGNPPYIAVKDGDLNAAYRRRWASAYRRYSLCCPFIELMFSLAGANQTKGGGA